MFRSRSLASSLLRGLAGPVLIALVLAVGVPAARAQSVPASGPAPVSVGYVAQELPASGSPVPGSSSYSIYRGPNTSSRVMLTYDDCPRSLSAFKEVVLAAERYDIALALFPTGYCLQSGKFSAYYARKHGHYVFNHTISHPDLTTLSSAAVRRELGSPGVVTNYGRPPYGEWNSTVKNAYAAKGMRMWLWNIDSRDWRGKTRSEVVRYVVRNSYRGATVLMHMRWNGFSPTAVRLIKAGLADRGLKVCRNYPGTTPAAPRVFYC